MKLTRDFENCRPVSFDKKSTKFNTGKVDLYICKNIFGVLWGERDNTKLINFHMSMQ